MSWQDYLAHKKTLASDPVHLPYRLWHGQKTARSVLLIHGAYSSPHHFRDMARSFFEAGHNVVTVTLPGHWERDLRSLDHTSSEAWVREADLGYEFALELGEQVVLAGHSLGGLLALEQANKRPATRVAGLVLLAPAVKLWGPVVTASRAGVAMDLSGNTFLFRAPDGRRVPYFSARVGLEIARLSKAVRAQKLATPLFLASTWKDALVDTRYARRWSQQQLGPRQLLTYSLWQGIGHGSISTGPSDEVTYGNGRNPFFNEMMQDALAFLAEQK